MHTKIFKFLIIVQTELEREQNNFKLKSSPIREYILGLVRNTFTGQEETEITPLTVTVDSVPKWVKNTGSM